MKNINASNALIKAKELLAILAKNDSAVDLSDCVSKLQNVIESSKDDEIKIVLLGSISDGKTSMIAGLLGEILDNMKIDSDESSDELVVYRPQSLKKGFVIIDTPGLFGSKEKEIDGENVLLSDITKKYISEAHIVLYVTSAVAPVKGSHSSILKLVLRDLGKLDSTIFVLNKMDETGANITKEEEYQRMAETKKQFLIERLTDILSLTKEEISRLKIVCISADPKRKGIDKWMETPDKYYKLSRIPALSESLNKMIDTANKDILRSEAYLSSINDAIRTFSLIYINYVSPLRKNIDIFSEDYKEMKRQLDIVYDKLMKSRSEMFRRLDSYRKNLMRKIDECSFEEMSGLLHNDLGVEKDNVTFYVVQAEADAILNDCLLSNNSALECVWLKMEQNFQKQDTMLKDLAGKGINALKGVNNKAVLAVRDMFFKGYKFKPWGAVKCAKVIGKVAVVLQVIFMAIEFGQKYKKQKDLNETKNGLRDAISSYFADLYRLKTNDDDFLKKLAPSYLKMQELLEERRKEYEALNLQLQKVENLKLKVSVFLGQDIEDIEFEEI